MVETVIRYFFSTADHFEGLVQERRNSSVVGMDLRLSRINPSISYQHFHMLYMHTSAVLSMFIVYTVTENYLKHPIIISGRTS